MKKLLLACTVVLGLCTLGQVANADPYHRHGYGYYGYRHGGYYGRYYGGYGFYGPPIFATGIYFAPPPVYYYPPPRPGVYEGRIVQEEVAPRSSRSYDNSK